MNNRPLVDAVAEFYSQRAKSVPDTPCELEPHRLDTDECDRVAKKAAQSAGYTQSDLDSIPAAAKLGLGCGNPINAADLKDGEVVVDLGSGSGIDVLLAALKVGPHGQAIGIDVSADMIALARQNANQKRLTPPRAAFIQASLAEPLPIAPNTVDCVLSNCVINLLPHDKKEDILKEAHRILKPGGRLVLDDIVARHPLSEEIRTDLTAYVNCISGSILVEEYKALLQTSGFTKIALLETGVDLQQICGANGSGCCSKSTAHKPKYDANAHVASCQVTAVKDSTECAATSASVLLRWWDAYPKVKSEPKRISIEELEVLMRGSPTPGDFVVIDVRRDDRIGGYVRGSENWFAQTFYDDLPAFFEKHQNTNRVIFYCGSSSGRGPRCAGWYQDYLDVKAVTSSTAYVLQGGVKAWLAKYGDQEDLVEV